MQIRARRQGVRKTPGNYTGYHWDITVTRGVSEAEGDRPRKHQHSPGLALVRKLNARSVGPHSTGCVQVDTQSSPGLIPTVELSKAINILLYTSGPAVLQ